MVATDTRNGGGSAATFVKQEHFDRVVRQELVMAHAALRKPHPEWPTWNPRRRVLYIDLNAGPGYVGADDWPRTRDDLCDAPPGPGWSSKGSPLLALRAALELEIPIKMVLCERNPAHCRALKEALIDELMDHLLGAAAHETRTCPGCGACDRWAAEAHLDELVTILEGDHNETVPALLAEHPEVWAGKRPFFGLIYADPYGKNDLPLGPLVALSRVPCLKRVEILVNVAATAYKRVRGAGLDTARLFEDLAGIDRAHRWIREPLGRWQWTMLLATNTPQIQMKRRLGFHRTDADEGRALIARLNTSANERRDPASCDGSAPTA